MSEYWSDMSKLALPDDGRKIMWRRKGQTEWQFGVVNFCWCGIEPAIKLVGGTDIMPTIGDEWRYL